MMQPGNESPLIEKYSGKTDIAELDDALDKFGFFEADEAPAIKNAFAEINKKIEKGEFYFACMDLRDCYAHTLELYKNEDKLVNAYYSKIIDTLNKMLKLIINNENLPSNKKAHFADDDVLDDIFKEIFDIASGFSKGTEMESLKQRNKYKLNKLIDDAHDNLPDFYKSSRQKLVIS